MPCNRVGKHTDSKVIACQGLTFLSPYGALCLLDPCANTAQALRILFPLLNSQAPPYYKAIGSIQFAYTGDRFGAYLDPASTVFKFHTLSEGEMIFTLAFRQLYTLGPTPGSLHLRLSPSVLTTNLTSTLTQIWGHTCIYFPLAGICPQLGRTSVGTLRWYWSLGRTIIYPL